MGNRPRDLTADKLLARVPRLWHEQRPGSALPERGLILLRATLGLNWQIPRDFLGEVHDRHAL